MRGSRLRCEPADVYPKSGTKYFQRLKPKNIPMEHFFLYWTILETDFMEFNFSALLVFIWKFWVKILFIVLFWRNFRLERDYNTDEGIRTKECYIGQTCKVILHLFVKYVFRVHYVWLTVLTRGIESNQITLLSQSEVTWI